MNERKSCKSSQRPEGDHGGVKRVTEATNGFQETSVWSDREGRKKRRRRVGAPPQSQRRRGNGYRAENTLEGGITSTLYCSRMQMQSRATGKSNQGQGKVRLGGELAGWAVPRARGVPLHLLHSTSARRIRSSTGTHKRAGTMGTMGTMRQMGTLGS